MTTVSIEPGSRPAPHLGDLHRRDAADALVQRWVARRVAPVVAIIVVVAVVALALHIAWWLVLVGVLVGIGLTAAWAIDRLDHDPLRQLLPVLVGEPVDPHRDARFVNLVDNLAFVAGSVHPELRVIDTPAVNGMVVQGSNGAVLVATRGLLDNFSLMELEGLLSVLLARLRHGDARLAATAVTLLPRERRGEALGRGRVIGFDLEAVALTLYPPGLASAFEKIASMDTAVDAPDELDWFWLFGPQRLGGDETPDIRAAVMREL